MASSVVSGLECATAGISDVLKASLACNQRELANICKKVEGVQENILVNVNNINDIKTIYEGSTSSKNHALRFNLEDSSTGAKKTSWGFKPTRKSIFGIGSEGQDYEDVSLNVFLM